MIVITKSDGDLKHAAMRIQSEYLAALKLIKASRNAKWRPRVNSPLLNTHNTGY